MIRSLLKPEAFDHPAEEVRLIQTHISWVLLAGDFAYKIKKPVRFGFLDYGTRSRRKVMCDREVALNRRTCPDAYVGAVPVVVHAGASRLFGAGRPIEHAVKMRRLSAEGWLSSRVDEGTATPELLRRVSESVRAFHAAAAHDEETARFESAAAVEAIWRENLDEIAAFVGDTCSAAELREITLFGERFLGANRLLVDRRASSGRVRDCHGDLRSDSIHVEPDGHICMTDCIEFSDRLRCGDVAGDVAFLAMDLDFRGRSDLSDEFCARYLEMSPDDETLSQMLQFFRCYRALVRGKVESIMTREFEIGHEQAIEARDRATRYFGLARQYAAEPFPQVMVVLGGLSGTGKSHLAAALAARTGAVLVPSDALRREMLMSAPELAAHPPAYSDEERRRVYEVARERVRAHLQEGRAVVFDATHLERRERDAARSLAIEARVPELLVWVDAPVTSSEGGSKRATSLPISRQMRDGARILINVIGWTC